MIPAICLFLAAAFLALSALAIVRAPTLPLVFLAVGVTELGHWFALVAVILAALVGPHSPPAAAMLLLAAAIFLTPVLRAWRAAPGLRRALGAFGNDAAFFRWRNLARLSINHRPTGEKITIDGPGGPLAIDFYPAASPERRAPLVVIAHGGGWMAGDAGELAGWNPWFTARGYAVASVDYRLVPGAAWPAQRDDMLAAIDHLRANADRFGLDPDRIVLFGRSAGGQIASAIAAPGEHPWLRGCVCLYAPFDMDFAYLHSREDDVLRSRWLLRGYLGGTPEERPEHYRDASAYLTLRPSAPPFLLLHGRRDELVWSAQSRRFAERLTERRVPHALLELPWARHAFDFNLTGPGGQALAAGLAAFLDRVGRPKSELAPRPAER